MNVHERVIFDRPDLSALHVDFPKYSFMDMHHHTRYSDSYTRIKALLRRAKAKGIGVAVTDHNAIKGSIEAVHAADGTLVIPGIEVGCREGPHFLVYFYNLHELAEFYDWHVKPNLNHNPYHNLSLGMEQLVEAAGKYNSVIAAAHPCAPSYFNLMKRIAMRKINPNVMRDIDAIEVCSGQSFRQMNLKAITLAENFKKGVVGGSDGHVLAALGSTVTAAKASTVSGFLKAILKQRNTVVGWEMPLMQRIHPYSGMSVKYLRHPSTLPYYYRHHLKEGVFDKVRPGIRAIVPRFKRKRE